MPASADIGTNIEDLRAAHPDWSEEQILAAALNIARRVSGDAKAPPGFRFDASAKAGFRPKRG